MTAISELTELDSRHSNGISVTLLCELTSQRCYIEISTMNDEELFEVPSSEAMQAFQHPFVYATANSHGHGITV